MCLSSFAWRLGLLSLAQTEQVCPTLQFTNPQHLTRISKPFFFLFPFPFPLFHNPYTVFPSPDQTIFPHSIPDGAVLKNQRHKPLTIDRACRQDYSSEASRWGARGRRWGRVEAPKPSGRVHCAALDAPFGRKYTQDSYYLHTGSFLSWEG